MKSKTEPTPLAEPTAAAVSSAGSNAKQTLDPAPGVKSKKKPARRLLFKMTLILVGCAGLFLTLRWIGTSHFKGTVLKVYETGPEFRLEFAADDGDTYVLGNQNLGFPYFKTDAQELHAKLRRFSRQRDVVTIKVWGYRGAWLGFYPNVIEAEFAESSEQRARRKAEQMADAVITVLHNRGALSDDAEVREDIIKAIVQADSGATAKDGH